MYFPTLYQFWLHVVNFRDWCWSANSDDSHVVAFCKAADCSLSWTALARHRIEKCSVLNIVCMAVLCRITVGQQLALFQCVFGSSSSSSSVTWLQVYVNQNSRGILSCVCFTLHACISTGNAVRHEMRCGVIAVFYTPLSSCVKLLTCIWMLL